MNKKRFKQRLAESANEDNIILTDENTERLASIFGFVNADWSSDGQEVALYTDIQKVFFFACYLIENKGTVTVQNKLTSQELGVSFDLKSFRISHSLLDVIESIEAGFTEVEHLSDSINNILDNARF